MFDPRASMFLNVDEAHAEARGGARSAVDCWIGPDTAVSGTSPRP